MAILEPLSYKQQKFCEEYLLSFNAYRAALTAGYTDNTARKGDLLHVPKIQAYLKQAMTRSAARAELTHDMLLRELMKIAFCNMGNYYDDQGNPKRMHQLTDEEKAAMSYFHREDVMKEDGYITGEVFKIKLYNKMAAIDRLCKHTGFYKAQWKPNEIPDMNETAEDIAFEAECAKTQREPYSDEVVDELLGQMGLMEDACLPDRQGICKTEGVVKEAEGQKPDDKSGSGGLQEDDGYEKDDVDLMWELGRQVDARAARRATAGDAPSLCTFNNAPSRKAMAHEDATAHKGKNILTFSPLANQNRDAEIVAIAAGTAYQGVGVNHEFIVKQ